MANGHPYETLPSRVWRHVFTGICALVYVFLVAPILVVIPLSFNAEPYFTFTPAMLSFDPAGYSTRWYEQVFASEQWLSAVQNSFFIAVCATLIATSLGTLAAIGLSYRRTPFRSIIMAILISPMIVPVIITGAAVFFFYSSIGLAQTFPGLILAHAALGTPFVVITVTATLVGFNHSLIRASASLGAPPTTTFFSILVPLILPGVVSGALFAFITSFDEVVVALFLAGVDQRTIPRQMWSGMREQISPTILSVATMLVVLSVFLMTTLELLRRRNERMRGIRPA